MPEKNGPYDDEDQTQQENKDGDAVDPMHIPHPLGMRGIRVPFFNEEILG
jgi:hypothetical protein